MRKTILSNVKKHDTLIILGETACGKTTQIPQVSDKKTDIMLIELN